MPSKSGSKRNLWAFITLEEKRTARDEAVNPEHTLSMSGTQEVLAVLVYHSFYDPLTYMWVPNGTPKRGKQGGSQMVPDHLGPLDLTIWDPP